MTIRFTTIRYRYDDYLYQRMLLRFIVVLLLVFLFVNKLQHLLHVWQSLSDLLIWHIIQSLVRGNAHRFSIILYCIFCVGMICLMAKYNADGRVLMRLTHLVIKNL